MKLLFIILICLLIIFLLLLIPVKIVLTATLEKAEVKFSVLGFNIPTNTENNKKGKNKSFKDFLKGKSLSDKLSNLFNILKEVLNKIKFILKRIKIEKFDLNIIVASTDAAATAIEYGAVCAVVYPLVSLILNNKTRKENINIVCDYTLDKSQLEFHGKASVRLIHLLAVLSILPRIIQKTYKKED